MARINTVIATPSSLTAAATRVNVEGTPGKIADTGGWKKQAWAYYDSIGELHFVCNWLGNALSRVRLYAAEVGPDGKPSGETTSTPNAAQIVNDIAGGPAGQAKLLSRMATGLTVVGETWIAVISRADETGAEVEEWHVLSADEINQRGNTIILKLEADIDHEFDPSRDILTRVHRPHPKNSRDSDSPVRSALQPLSEIARTSAAIEGASKSRLTGNGILALPQEISMPVAEAPKADPDAPGLPTGQPQMVERTVSAQDIMVQLQEVMTTAISDPSSAAAMVPIVLKAPGDTLDSIRHITFESDVTETNLNTRESAVQRLARSLDVPAEILTGTGDTNHWSAWSIDDDAVRTHVAPLMTIICDALTEAIFRPLLDQSGLDPRAFVVWFDTTELTRKQNRSEDAINAYDRGAISSDALRRELGFDDADAPEANGVDDATKDMARRLVEAAPSLLPQLAHVLDIPAPEGGWGTPGNAPAAAPAAPPEPSDYRQPPAREGN